MKAKVFACPNSPAGLEIVRVAIHDTRESRCQTRISQHNCAKPAPILAENFAVGFFGNNLIDFHAIPL